MVSPWGALRQAQQPWLAVAQPQPRPTHQDMELGVQESWYLQSLLSLDNRLSIRHPRTSLLGQHAQVDAYQLNIVGKTKETCSAPLALLGPRAIPGGLCTCEIPSIVW
jgi:hypothetical protein